MRKFIASIIKNCTERALLVQSVNQDAKIQFFHFTESEDSMANYVQTSVFDKIRNRYRRWLNSIDRFNFGSCHIS